MDFIEKIQELSARIPKQLEHIQTEEATKFTLVAPLIRAMGYDTTDPREVLPEYTADVFRKKGEKVDFAIFISEKPMILFECKWSGSDLDSEHANQLKCYFDATEARFGVLTNGIAYRFFTDLEKQNLMDSTPFFEFNMVDARDESVTELKKFTKSSFDLEDILSTANELKYTREIARTLSEEWNQPSEDFVYFLAKRVYEGSITKSVREQFAQISKRALHQFMSDRIEEVYSRVKSNLDAERNAPLGNSPKGDQEPLAGEAMQARGHPQIVTTEDEIEGYHIAKSILRETIDVKRVVMRDRASYCGILLDNNQRKPICRLHFNRSQKYLGLFDEQGNHERVPISDLDDIYEYADRLTATVARYDAPKMSGAESDTQRLEELESIEAYDEAKASNDESVPLRQALAEIERERE